MTDQNKKTVPVQKHSSGTVSAAIWSNTIQTADGPKTVQNITFQRGYKDDTGQWKNTDSYTPASLGNLLSVVLQAIVSCGTEQTVDIPT